MDNSEGGQPSPTIPLHLRSSRDFTLNKTGSKGRLEQLQLNSEGMNKVRTEMSQDLTI